MSATKAFVNKAFEEYRKQMWDEVEKRCRSFCAELCKAAVKFRKEGPGHNYTGNLMNSIVVVLYRSGKPIHASYANDIMPNAIQFKMTASHKKYVFRRDYDGTEHTIYLPELETNEFLGLDDAMYVAQNYKPAGHNMFDILVAYSTEYAQFIESQRQSTGIIKTYAHAESVGIEFLGLPKAS